jgi:hypothetical protein
MENFTILHSKSEMPWSKTKIYQCRCNTCNQVSDFLEYQLNGILHCQYCFEIGRKYGKLTILQFVKMSDFRPIYKAKCNCGSEILVSLNFLKSGKIQSCACSMV